ncbi:MAG: twin-arginine translocase TatA/TatE family subunit [Candidatus Alcyoniella australis]|nr:twin-arginine translocase TatA/TatE family subunit [Candidatus Alcyoniella australis]
MIGNLGMGELVIIMAIVLIIFGVGKLPEIGAGLGKGIREFRKANHDEIDVTPKDKQLKDEDKAE